jgi:hypothetical protein
VIPHPIVAAAAGFEGTVCARNDVAEASSIYAYGERGGVSKEVHTGEYSRF